MKTIFYIVILALLFSCSDSNNEYMNRSVQMANSIMSRNDSLVNFMARKDVWAYDYAFLAGSIGKLSEYTGDKKYFNYMKDYMDYYINDEGVIRVYRLEEYNLDRIRPGVNFYTLYNETGDKKYKVAVNSLIEQLKTHPKTTDGGFWHKKVYPYQMWLDGIFMACPFMAEYAVTFNEPQWFDEIEKQITQIYEHTVDDKTGLLYHAWDESREQRWSDPVTGQSKHFWSRAMGWYAMALVDVLDFMPENHSGYKKIIDILNNISAALVKVQDLDTGIWYQVLDMGDREGNYLEASGTCMFAYTFAKGVRKGYLPELYLPFAEKAYEGVWENLIQKDPDGEISLLQTCGGCGLGGNPYRDGSYEYYINEKVFVNDPKGLAPFIIAGIELSRVRR